MTFVKKSQKINTVWFIPLEPCMWTNGDKTFGNFHSILRTTIKTQINEPLKTEPHNCRQTPRDRSSGQTVLKSKTCF